MIAGNGPERDNLKKLVTGEGLDRHVRFLGYTTQLQRYLEAADVEIACSYREGLPLNIIEAMLCGKPVVASDNRGHREIVRSGINGCLVNADDTEAYSAAICRLLSGEAGDCRSIRQSVRIYTDKSVMQELEEIYLHA